MRREIYNGPNLRWIDLSNPGRDELELLQKEFNLHPAMIQDTLDPIHLPKFEKLGQITFFIIRIYDLEASLEADTVEDLTRKIAVFVGPDFLLTAHRLSLEYFDNLSERCLTEISEVNTPSMTTSVMLVKFLNRALRKYSIPLEHGEETLEKFETHLFSEVASGHDMAQFHIVRRRLSLIKRILIHTQDVILRLSPSGESTSPLFQDLRENLGNLIFIADEHLEEVTNLLNMQISLSSHRTNEVVRVLTVFSVFFLPLTFVVGVYGMNFKHIPEFDMEYGYAMVWLIMIGITIAIGFWFNKRGWLKFD